MGFLTGCRKLCDRTGRGSLGSLAARVGVNLGIEDADVDVLAGSQDMIHTAEADVIAPAVAAEDPLALLRQEVFALQDLFAFVTAAGLKSCDQSIRCCAVRRAITKRIQPCLSGLCDLSVRDQSLDLRLQAVTQSVLCKQHTETEFCCILEQGIRPRRALSLLVEGVRCRR